MEERALGLIEQTSLLLLKLLIGEHGPLPQLIKLLNLVRLGH